MDVNHLRVTIVSDSEWQSGVPEINFWIGGARFFEAFEGRDYGPGLAGVAICLMCRDPAYGFKRRIRHSKKQSILYMDIMLNHEKFVSSSFEERKIIVLKLLLVKVSEIVRKYSIKEFKCEAFLGDFDNEFARHLTP